MEEKQLTGRESIFVDYFESTGIIYLDSNPILKKLLKNPIYYGVIDPLLDQVYCTPFPFTSPYAVLDSSIDIREEISGRKRSSLEIVTYESIKKRGWQIVKRPVVIRSLIAKKQNFLYYLRHVSDKKEAIGSIINDQPQHVLIQVDHINQLIRLIGREVSVDGRKFSVWRRFNLKA